MVDEFEREFREKENKASLPDQVWEVLTYSNDESRALRQTAFMADREAAHVGVSRLVSIVLYAA